MQEYSAISIKKGNQGTEVTGVGVGIRTGFKFYVGCMLRNYVVRSISWAKTFGKVVLPKLRLFTSLELNI